MELLVTLANGKKPLTNVTRRSIIDVTEVVDAPLKPVTMKSLKMNKSFNSKIMSTTKKMVD